MDTDTMTRGTDSAIFLFGAEIHRLDHVLVLCVLFLYIYTALIIMHGTSIRCRRFVYKCFFGTLVFFLIYRVDHHAWHVDKVQALIR
jgi:hypothetical protein